MAVFKVAVLETGVQGSGSGSAAAGVLAMTPVVRRAQATGIATISLDDRANPAIAPCQPRDGRLGLLLGVADMVQVNDEIDS